MGGEIRLLLFCREKIEKRSFFLFFRPLLDLAFIFSAFFLFGASVRAFVHKKREMASTARIERSAATTTALCAASLLVVGGATWLYFSHSSSRRMDGAAREGGSREAIDDDDDADEEKADDAKHSAVPFSALLSAHLPSDRARSLAAAHPSASLRALQDVVLPPPCSLPPPCEPVLVETFEELREVTAKNLGRARIVGVDVEHSSDASYLGRVCTIQLSCAVGRRDGGGERRGGGSGDEAEAPPPLETLPETFVVDVVALRENNRRSSSSSSSSRGKGERRATSFSPLFSSSSPSSPPEPTAEDLIADVLSPVLSDPRVLKVFHNGSSDLLWLQRDFPTLSTAAHAGGGAGGISPVADTSRLARALGLRSDGLPAVLEFAAREAAAAAAAEASERGNDESASKLALLAAAEAAAATKAAAQRGDWLSRPLFPSALSYAAHDAHYLPFAAFLMSRKLEDLEREGEDAETRTSRSNAAGNVAVAVARESLAAAWAVCYRPPAPEAAARAAARRIIACSAAVAARAADANDETSPPRPQPLLLRGAFADAALALCRWRDAAARELDLPCRVVLPDESVAALAGLTGAHGGGGLAEDEDDDDEGGRSSAVVAVAERAAAAAAASSSSSSSSHLPHLRAGAEAAAAAIDEALQGLHRWEEEGGAEGIGGVAGEATVAVSGDDDSAHDGGDGDLRAEKKRRNPKRPKTRLGRAIERFAAKKPVYHSCRLLSCEGALLAFVDRKKLEWYLHKGLAEVAEEETDDEDEDEGGGEEVGAGGAGEGARPRKEKSMRVSAARLLFEHARFGGGGAGGGGGGEEGTERPQQHQLQRQQEPTCPALLPDLFPASPRENRCVGCGRRDHYLRSGPFFFFPSKGGSEGRREGEGDPKREVPRFSLLALIEEKKRDKKNSGTESFTAATALPCPRASRPTPRTTCYYCAYLVTSSPWLGRTR